MRTTLLAALLIIPGLFVAGVLHADSVDKAALKAEAIGIVKQFGGTLKPQLKTALKEGGPAHAISVCSTTAPEIAKSLSQSTGWSVKRVSLKARNTETAMPDAWEKSVLAKFDERQAGGESAQKMAYAEVVDGQFRFMKAQGVEEVCLKCHAEKIAPETEKALQEHYADDNARGYTLGQIRGAFSLSKQL
ncbi:MAG: DUF3365 domain-containing protein [Proteobacteria bacterium]|nr:DUF3365 domain-containing protein [Pseudomonadota bacterium]